MKKKVSGKLIIVLVIILVIGVFFYLYVQKENELDDYEEGIPLDNPRSFNNVFIDYDGECGFRSVAFALKGAYFLNQALDKGEIPNHEGKIIVEYDNKIYENEEIKELEIKFNKKLQQIKQVDNKKVLKIEFEYDDDGYICKINIYKLENYYDVYGNDTNGL